RRPDWMRAIADSLILTRINSIALGMNPSTAVIAFNHAFLVVEALNWDGSSVGRVHISLRAFLVQLQTHSAEKLHVVASCAIETKILHCFSSGCSFWKMVWLHTAQNPKPQTPNPKPQT